MWMTSEPFSLTSIGFWVHYLYVKTLEFQSKSPYIIHCEWVEKETIFCVIQSYCVFSTEIILLMGSVFLCGNLFTQISTYNSMVTFWFPQQPVVSLIFCNKFYTGRILERKEKKQLSANCKRMFPLKLWII